MTLVLLYLVVLVLVGIVLFAVGSVLFGRGEVLPPLPQGTTATVLPASGVTGSDVDLLAFFRQQNRNTYCGAYPGTDQRTTTGADAGVSGVAGQQADTQSGCGR